MAVSENSVLTAREALRLGTERLERAGIASARLDMSLLLAHALNTTRLHLYTDLDRPLTDAERQAARGLLARRLAREPIAYIFGEREFFGLPFIVTSDVLIPRPETEHLVEAAIEWIQENAGRVPEPLIADIGTGSGIIAVSLAVTLPNVRVIATDVSEKSIDVARANAERHGVADRIEFRIGSLLAPIQEKIDVLCSNPPYVSESEKSTLEPEVVQWEPAQALFSGDEGLAHLRALIADAPRIVRPGGLVLLECGRDQAETASLFAAADARYGSFDAINDLAAIPRVLRIKLQ